MARRIVRTRTSHVKPTLIKFKIALSINRGIHPGKSGFLPINSRARHRHYLTGRLSAVPDWGSSEYTIMRIDCGRQRHRERGFTFQSNSATGCLGVLAEAAISSLRVSAIVCAFLAILVVSATAQARPPFRVGGLTCSTGPRVGLVLGSRQDMRCVFVASATGQQYVYTGTIRRLGVDIGVTRGGTLFWAVFARNSQIGRGTLRGSYVGASANVAVGLGLGAKALIGGSRRTITLQPLSVEGQIGVNLALGVARLTLR